ncbi:unnamed protein product [Pseudo-nitzschia multistriata]|uniref:Uncharacterized protein n=1 Tax=Pseudo-nitzschia multistriata TaxID=183589 RepID=A0A448Z9S4_9STRA|nr:unnamed protein product [Pseudo-nitzschia multistriata]
MEDFNRKENGDDKQYDGIWIGIDLGTSNSTCAVWDSSRGGAKWVRLPDITESTSSKAGRIMPSIVRFPNGCDDPLVGFPALLKTSVAENSGDSTKCGKSSVLRSVKRLLGKRYDDLDPSWLETLDFDVRNPSEYGDNDDRDQSLQLIPRVGKSFESETIAITPQDVLALELKAIRTACQSYLDKYRLSKSLKVPGGGEDETTNYTVDNVVVGVPAHFSHRHIGLVKEACREAGFHGYVGTCLESTAAAIAYGLTLQERGKGWTPGSDSSASMKINSTNRKGGPTFMVVDMGGGTTDITIAIRREKLQQYAKSSPSLDEDEGASSENNPSSSFRVLVTEGDDGLGGDDIDEAIMEYYLGQVVSKERSNDNQNKREMNKTRSDSLKLACRKAKESLCSLEDPSPSVTVGTEGQEVEISREVFDTIILEPWLRRARDLIMKALDCLKKAPTMPGVTVDEVILVGGTTRIRAIRHMIQNIFPQIELSLSLNPMSSVSQGLAIQAAILSKQIPIHELKSAMMLDCVPHAIGVQLQPNGGFVEIIPRNALLPAVGSATFVLADKYQAGVSIRAVEEVGPDTYELMSKEDFSFVLRKLSSAQFENISERKIQVGMKLDNDGRFIVSIFDENDPEQVRKRDRFERIQQGEEIVGELDYIKDMILADSDGITNEQITLVVALISVFVLYVAVKMAFADPLEHGNAILG